MSERATFSPFWHRVRQMKPRLRPHVEITRQHYRGRRWHVVRDPSSNQFYRLSPVAYEFVGLFDSHRTIEELWKLGLTRHGDESLTQNDVIQLLSQLYSANLLAGDTSPETDQLLRRGRERLGKKVQQQAIGLMYFKVKLFNPDGILTWLEPILRPILNRWGLMVWLLWVIAGFTSVIPQWERLRDGFGSTVAPSNWAWMIVVFIVVKLIHETGHGIICKRFGGHVPEFGAMMLVLLPAPYVDASSSWAFESKWRRMAVGAGGMIFELTVASAAAFVWLATPEGNLLHQIAYNVMFTASVSTVVFNANPLMRFDGYYILSDWLEVPNLMQRSTQMLKFLAQKHIYKVRNPTPPTSSGSEALILLVYGIGAMIYRIVLFISITLYVMGKLFAIGLLLAIWTGAMWFILPVGGFLHWLATNAQLSEKRPRAIFTTIGLAALVILLVGIIPMPDRRRAVGVVESATRSGVFFAADGFVEVAHVKPGDLVKAGDPIATCVSPQIQASIELGEAQLAEAISKEQQAMTRTPAEAQVAAEYVASIGEQVAYFREQKTRLVVRAPHDGRVVTADPASLLGSYVRAGQPLCEVVDESQLRIAATLSQDEAAWLHEYPSDKIGVEYRLKSDVRHVINGVADKPLPSGINEIPHPGLGYAGGGSIETRRDDQSGMATARPMFKVYVYQKHTDAESTGPGKLLNDGSLANAARPGERVALRFTLPSQPLLSQWIDRLQKLVQGRAKV